MANTLIKSACRVFEILELFRSRKSPLRLKDITQELRLPTSSTAALLKTMLELNYLSFDSTMRQYSPTLKLSELGSWVALSSYESGPIQEAVHRIHRKIGETILLGTVSDVYVEIVDILRARQPLHYYTHVGSKVLLVHSGIGWPLLSEIHADDIADVYRRTLSSKRPGVEIRSLTRLRREIGKVRKDGYCLSTGMVTQGVGVVGLVLPTPPNHRRLAIGVAGPQERINKNLSKILMAVRAERSRLRMMLGE